MGLPVWHSHFKTVAIAVLVLLFYSAFASTSALAANSPGLSYHGRIVKPDGTALDSLNVRFRVQIRTPDVANCLLFEEESLLNLSGKDGVFSVSLNNGTNNRTDTTGLSIDRVFGNRGTIAVTPSNCSYGNGVYTPTSSDGRNIQVSFRDETMTAWETLPVQSISYVPLAIEAKQVGGFTAASLLRVEDASGPQPAPPLSPANLTELFALVQGASGRYIPANPSGAIIPSRATDPTGASAGQMWFDTSTNSFKYYDGNAVQSFANGGAQPPLANGKIWIGSATSAATAQTVSGDATLSTAGALALKATGTAGTYTGVTTDAQGRVISGTTTLTEAQLPTIVTPGKVSGAAINTGTIGGNAAVNTTGNVTAANLSATSVSQQNLLIYEPSNTRKITISAPAVTANYALKLPAAAPGAGQFLVSDLLGNLSWTATTGLSQWTTTGSDIYYSTGKVGIGTTTPTQALDVNGNINARSQIILADGTTTAPSMLINGRTNSGIRVNNAGNNIFFTINGVDNFGVYGTYTSLNVPMQVNFNGSVTDNAIQRASDPGTGLYFPSAGNIAFSSANSERMRIDAAGNVGIGTSSPSAPLNIDNVQTGNTGTIAGTYSNQRVQPTAPSNALVRSGYYLANISTTSNSPSFDGRGLEGAFFNGGAATIGSITGTLGYVANTNAGGTITNAQGIYGGVSSDTGTITNAYGGAFSVGGAGTITNGYGVRIGNIAGTTTKWSLYSSDATAPSLFAGSVAIGSAAPTVSLDLSTRTDAVALPRGLDATRPAVPAMGMFRYSTASNALEFYNGTSWQTLSAGGAAGSLTNVSTISNSGGGISLTASAGNSVQVTNGTTSLSPTSGALIVTGGVGISENLNVAQNLTTNGSISAINATAATGAANRNSPSIYLTANYWDGTASALDKFSVTNLVGTGANPTATLTFDHPSGTTGSTTYAFMNGLVGIGTNVPAQVVDIKSPLASPGNLRLNTTAVTGAGSLSNVIFARGDATKWTVGNAGTTSDLFNIANGAGTSALSILQSNGNVGIGTITPGQKLDVNGNVGLPNGGAIMARDSGGTFRSVISWPSYDDVSVGSTNNFVVLNTGSVGRVRIGASGLSTPATVNNLNALDIGGGAAFGSYAGVNAAPTNGLIVSGNVGVGTSVPASPLTIVTSAASSDRGLSISYSGNDINGSVVRMSKSRSGATVASGDELGRIAVSGWDGTSTVDNSKIVFGVDSTVSTGIVPTSIGLFTMNPAGAYADRLHVTSSGSVGIGTTSPSHMLEVAGAIRSTMLNGSVQENLLLTNTSLVSGSGSMITFGNSVKMAQVGSIVESTNTDSSLTFATRQTTGNPTEKMRITSSGSVGIGTTVPGEKLQVAGNISASNYYSGLFGTAAAPTFAANGGGLYMPATNNVALSTASTERLRIDASGNVGIATTAPATALDVNGAFSVRGITAPAVSPTGQGRIYFDSISNQFLVSSNTGAYTPLVTSGGSGGGQASSSALTFNSDSDNSGADGGFNFQRNGTNLLTISNAGDTAVTSTTVSSGSSTGALRVAGGVGIAGAMNVGGAINAAGGITATNGALASYSTNNTAYTATSSSVAVPGGSLVQASNASVVDSTAASLLLRVNNSNPNLQSAYVSAVSATGAGVYSPSIVFGQQTGATAYAERMRIDANGFVGVGTTTPQRTLDVFSSSTEAGRFSSSTADAYVSVNGSGSTAGNQGIGVNSGDIYLKTNNTERLRITSSGSFTAGNSTASQLGIDQSMNSIYFRTNNAERLRIDSAGNFGIGATAPVTKLQVAGSIMLGNGAEICGATYYGAIRFNTPNLELCNSSGWTVLSSSGGGGTYSGVSSISNTGGSITLAPETTAGAVLITSTTASNGSNSGALVVSGGVGVTGNVNASGNIYSSNSVTSGGTMGTISAVAVSGTNRSSPGISLRGAYWDGSASQVDSWSLNNVLGTGTTPSSTLSFTHTGSPGTTQYSFMNGNVGIGTASPTRNLSFTGNSAQTVGLERSTAGAGGDLTINAGGALAGATNTVGGNLVLSSGIFTGNGGGGDIVFKTPVNGASGTTDQVPNNRMIISGNTGNVGIGGVPSPVPVPLTVFGNIRTVSNKSAIGDTIPGFQLSGLNSATNQTLYGTYEAGVESPTSGSENGFLSLKTTRSSVMTEALRISAGGNVGIATTTPSSALSFGGDTSRVIAMERSSTATANPLTVAAGGTVPSATNGNGGTLILQSGIATGAGGSTIDFRTATPNSSGTSDNTPSSKMTILGNGLVGIGTSASYTSNDRLALYAGGAYPVAISMKTLNSYPVSFIQDESSTFTIFNSNAARITIPATGNVGIGLSPNASYKLDVAGDANLSSGSALRIAGTSICTSAGCTATSDVRLKENILPLQMSLDKILQLKGVSYDWIDKKKFGSSKQIGLIAQELEKVYPEVVVTDSKTGFKSVAYDHLIAPIIESIKALYDKITKAEARILNLEVENKQLRAASATLRKDSEAMRKYLCQKDPNAAFCK